MKRYIRKDGYTQQEIEDLIEDLNKAQNEIMDLRSQNVDLLHDVNTYKKKYLFMRFRFDNIVKLLNALGDVINETPSTT